MITRLGRLFCLFAGTLGLVAGAVDASAQSWRGVSSVDGITWARVLIVNNSPDVSNWGLWNCRTAVDSSGTTALTDQELNWDGVVNPGETRYVWVYSTAFVDVNIGSAGGTDTGLQTSDAMVDSGDSDLVITIAADGTMTSSLAAGATYDAPTHSGSFDPNS